MNGEKRLTNGTTHRRRFAAMCGKVFKLSVINSVVGCCISHIVPDIHTYSVHTLFMILRIFLFLAALPLFYEEVLHKYAELCEWTHRFDGEHEAFSCNEFYGIPFLRRTHDNSISLLVLACFFFLARNEIETEIYASVKSLFVRSKWLLRLTVRSFFAQQKWIKSERKKKHQIMCVLFFRSCTTIKAGFWLQIVENNAAQNALNAHSMLI